jgi:hypothetical protein
VVTPLRTAIRKRHRDLVLLLICNGYRLDLEPSQPNSVLDEALAVRAFDILDLLLEWGAEPTTARVYNIIDTYRADLIDRFWRAGVDYSQDPEFEVYLASTVNKPLYGWLRRNRSDQRLRDALDIALLEAVTEDEELPVRLLLWAGADPHRKVPMARELGRPDAWSEYAVFSASTAAITFGRHQLFDVLRMDSMPELEAQFSWAHDCWTLRKLVAIRTPSSWSEIILAFIGRLWQPFEARSPWDVRDALAFIASSGGKLDSASADQIGGLRTALLKVRENDTFLWLLRWLKNERHCVPPIYEEAVRTASVRQRILSLNVGARYLSVSRRTAGAERSRGGTGRRQLNGPAN